MTSCFLQNVHVVDVVTGSISDLMEVVVLNGVIEEINERSRYGEDCPQIDAEGGFVIPGLWDVHSHPGTAGPRNFFADAYGRVSRIRASLRRAMEAGIVGVRILGEALGSDVLVREEMRSVTDGPNQLLSVAGPALKPLGGHGAITIDADLPAGSTLRDQWGSYEAHDDASLRRAVGLLVEYHGVDWVKVFVSGGIAGEDETHSDTHLEEEQIRIICEAAAAHGVPVAAHAGNPEAIRRAVSAGVESIEHGYELSEENAVMMAANDVWFVPTISITHNVERMTGMSWSAETIAKAEEMQPMHRRSVENALKCGVRMASGSDMRPLSEAAVEEVIMLQQVGIPPGEALRLATVAAAELCGASELSGTLDVGKRADMVLLEENPLERLETILTPKLVINSGRVL